MQRKVRRPAWVLAGLLMAATAVSAHEKVRTGGVVGNNYSSTMLRIDDSTMRVTTRKQLNGSLAEVNQPGTAMYRMLVAVQNAAAVRAAVEARALGYRVLEVMASRDLTSPQELTVEIVVRGVPGDMPTRGDGRFLDVGRILRQFGIE